MPGPVAWVALPCSVLFRPRCQRADARLNGAIVPWHTWWREQVFHAELCEQFLHFVRNEGRSVIAFQDQRRAMGREQPIQRLEYGGRRHVVNRQPEQLLAARQITHGEQVGIESVDRGSWAVEVDGPDGAGPGPVQDPNRLPVAFAPDAAIAAQEFFQLGSGHPGELKTQGGQADARPQLVDQRQPDARATCRPACRPPRRSWSDSCRRAFARRLLRLGRD